MMITASHRPTMASSDDWRLVVAKQRSLRPGVHTSGKRSLHSHGNALPVAVRQGGLGEQCNRLVELGQRVHLGDRLDAADRVGCDRHRADGLLVTLVTDVEDAVALAGAHLHLVVDLGDERADGVDHERTALLGCGHHLGRRPMGRQHDRATRGHLVHVVDEHHATAFETLDDDPVVDDLVVAVDGWFEGVNHPAQRLDRHLDAGAEPSRFGQQHTVDVHRSRSIGRSARSAGAHRMVAREYRADGDDRGDRARATRRARGHPDDPCERR